MFPDPKFKNGDLVQGHYAFIEEYYWFEEFEAPFFHIGVVISCEYDDYFFNQYLYQILFNFSHGHLSGFTLEKVFLLLEFLYIGIL